MDERDYPALLDDLNSYLRLDSAGQLVEQARKQRDDVQRQLAAQAPGSTAAKSQP